MSQIDRREIQRSAETARGTAVAFGARMLARTSTLVILACASAALFGFAACSASSGASADDGLPRASTDDGGDSSVTVDAAAEGAAEASTRPPPPALEIIPNNGGPVIESPEIISITWTADPIGPALVAFDDWLVKSALFTTMMAEYGVKVGTHGGSYVVPVAAPATLDDVDVQALLQTAIQSGKVPAPNGSRIYTVYPPAGTVVTQGGVAGCTGFQAYHSSFAHAGEGGTALAIYAIAPRCADTQGLSALDFITWGQSHEVMEATSDPDYRNPTWVILHQTDQTPVPGENADLCVGHPTQVEGHVVTRNYSNVAAKAGTRPCVPAPPGPMFGIYANPTAITVAPGTTASVPIYAYATGTLPAFDLFAFATTSELTATLSKAKAADGDVLTLTVKASAAYQAIEGANTVMLGAISNGYQIRRPLVVGLK